MMIGLNNLNGLQIFVMSKYIIYWYICNMQTYIGLQIEMHLIENIIE